MQVLFPDEGEFVVGMRLGLLLIAAFGLPAVAGVAADPTANPAEHTAECVAALKVDAEDLAAQVRAGHEELRPVLLARLEQGAAFVGNSFLNGNRDEAQANAMLAAATEAQKSLSAKALAARQAACANEGARMLTDASGFGRAVVSRVAKSRMNKMLVAEGR